jgi:hypothetical protein
MRNKNEHEVSVNTILPVRREGDKKSQMEIKTYRLTTFPAIIVFRAQNILIQTAFNSFVK